MSNKLDKDATACSSIFSELCGFQYRHIIAILSAIGVTVAMIARGCTNVSLESFVLPKNFSITERRSHCPKGPGTDDDVHKSGNLPWAKDKQNLILFAFYVGYLLTQVPIGYVAERYGIKWPFLLTLLGTGVITAITPTIFETGKYWAVITVQVILGMLQGGLIPIVSVTVARWYPPSEHSRFGALYISSVVFGIVNLEVISYIYLKLFHMSVMYYTASALIVLWCIVFAIFGYSTPSRHRFITDEERDYIISNQVTLLPHSRLPPVPWKAMLSSLPVWANIVMYMGQNWVLYSLILNMPIYLHDVLRFSHFLVLVWSSFPILLVWLAAVIWGAFSDYLSNRELMSLNDIRKMNTMIAAFGTGLLMLFSSYARCHYVLAIAFYVLCMCASGPHFAGSAINYLDLSPNYAGTLMGITNTLGTIGALTPNMLDLINENSSLQDWRNSFWLDFSIISASSIIFLLFGSAKTQKWNFTEKSDISLP